jgi:uncharacterized protein (TIGR03435 family)
MQKSFAPALTAVILAAGSLLGQAQVTEPAFEVATIKPAPSGQEIVKQLQSGKTPRLGMTMDGARVNMGFQSLADLIRIAYRVKAYQVIGPDWMSQQRYEIQGKIPEGGSTDKVPEMVQALLAERFKLTIHRDKKDLPVYALIVGKNGSKLTPASTEPEAPLPDSAGAMTIGTENGEMKVTQDGKGGSIIRGGGQDGTIKQSISAAGVHMEMTKTSIKYLVDILTTLVDRPVLDMTDLKGNFQIALDLPMEDLILLAQRRQRCLGFKCPVRRPVEMQGTHRRPGAPCLARWRNSV